MSHETLPMMHKSHTSLTVGCLAVAVSLATAAGCIEKSRNRLSPTVAGPIAGVNISAPGLMAPSEGALISVDD